MKLILTSTIVWLWTLALGAGAEAPLRNASPAAPLVEATPQRGFFDAPVTVALTARKEGTTIRYTTNGSEPTAALGSPYSAPLRITNLTVLRAAAFEGSKRVSAVATHTYLFLDDVLRQPKNPPGLPSGPNAWNGFPSAYEMDPRVVNDPAYQPRLKDSLRALPVLSVVCRSADLFSPRTGLYLNSLQRGTEWERPCSVEWIQPDGGAGFAIDCEIQMQGNFNRIPEKSPKHSFRLVFKEQYGPAKLRFPIFPDSPVTNFNTLVLRAGYNNTWVHWEANQRSRGHPVRDAWLKDSQRAMGWLAGHDRFVHLYLNGLYWGIYDVAERPDAAFAASYLGGKREDYDVINESQVKDGTGEAFARLRSLRNLSATARYDQVAQHLHLTRFIDYMLLNYYVGNQDWGEHKNWYAIRRRDPPGPFQFFAWDGEHTFEGVQDDTVQRPYEQPFRFVSELMASAEFRLAFADRVQKHCFNDGALTPKACAERWMKRANEIDLAIIAESARWGYYRRNPPFTRDRDWAMEQRRLVIGYFPRRTEILLNQLREAGLYPNVAAPVIEPRKGNNGSLQLSLRAPDGGDIFYTTDGTDPRVYGTSAVAPSAVRYASAVELGGTVTVKARVLRSKVWSALTESGSKL